MKFRLIGPAGWGMAFALVAALVVGGLGWVTVASLRVEAAQLEATARADRASRERLALWRLDGHLLPALGLENNRPFGHYSTLYTQYPVWDAGQDAPAAGALQLASPLLSADLPSWMLLHFQLDPDRGWESPQVAPPELAGRLLTNFNLTLTNVTPQRAEVLADLRRRFPADDALASLAERERATPDENPFVVPVPVADETATPKPPGLSPGESDPGQPRPYGTGLELIKAPPAEVLSRLSQERRAIPPVATGWGRSNGTAPAFGMNSLSTVPGVERTAPAPIPPTMPAPFNAAVPGMSGANLRPYTASPQLADQPPSQAPAPPGKPEPQEQKGQGGDYAARSRATQDAVKQRGALENNQLMKPGAALPEKDKQTEMLPPAAPAAAPAGPAPGGQAGEPDRQRNQMRSDPKAVPPRPAGPESKAAKKATADWPPAEGGRPAMEAPGAGSFGGGVPGGMPGPAAGGLPAGGAAADAMRFHEERTLRADERAKAEAGPAAAREVSPDDVVRGSKKAAPTVQPINVQVGPLRPVWLTATDGSEALALVRAARLEGKIVFQGVLLDWPGLRAVLGEQVADLFPAAVLGPVRAADPPNPEHAMTALPVQLDPGPAPEPPPAGWSALRLGLVMAWAAALVGLTAVGFGGRALVDLSERRIRFVSAVTHELRTPLTSLRLYLDLLNSGLIEDEQKRKEYLSTLTDESERLHRLIENVLDFARLERRSVAAHTQPTDVADLLAEVHRTWADRCAADGKELTVVSTLPPGQTVTTDPRMVAQVLSNLVDNARKYTRDAADERIWVWAKPGERGTLLLEVEDRGPGVSACERGAIFRPFRRGKDADTTAGGAGLGLALAQHWAELLGGTLSYRVADGGVGACFRLELPAKG
ncbi:MAG TPA: ATP-binding protein [Fimbriiglobus sp.]|nr:ATP-binding protein [Fimbriiglobus sp.]